MSISPVLANCLSQKYVKYEVLEHSLTTSTMVSAREDTVPANKLAKAVLIKRGDSYVMCVIPASNQLVLEWLIYGRQHNYKIAEEKELLELFSSGTEGATPGLGEAFQMDVIIDNSLMDQKDIYIEGDDHTDLVHINFKDFSKLMFNAWPALISCLKSNNPSEGQYLWAPPENGG